MQRLEQFFFFLRSGDIGSQIQYYQKLWLKIHIKTHNLLYLGLPCIFDSTYKTGVLKYSQTTDQDM